MDRAPGMRPAAPGGIAAVSREPRIEPRTLKGFRDHLPASMMAREAIMETARRVYRSYGFRPIDTPALEYLEILTGKGGEETDKQLYKFQDHGGRWVGMRFDLTVPLARFVAQHAAELGTPFKRYHIATVWRGENTQHGRFREFMQCDFDTIGTRSIASDTETVLVIHDLLLALGFEQFTIRVNHRQVLRGLLEQLSIADRSGAVLRALDKLAKVGRDKVEAELVEGAGIGREQAVQVLNLASLSGSNEQILSDLAPFIHGSEAGERGVGDLAELVKAAGAAGVPPGRLDLDVGIARGLDYYTGVVFETFLRPLPQIGSVCSGGRYDDLAGLYTNLELPGVGASLGVDRLLEAMRDLGMVKEVSTPAPVFIPLFEAARLGDYLALASKLRKAGFGVEVYSDPKRLGQQLKYADRQGFRAALIIGGDEWAAETCQVKNLASGESRTVSIRDGIGELELELRKLLDSPA
jgi:histidyl-tRNA synthetase